MSDTGQKSEMSQLSTVRLIGTWVNLGTFSKGAMLNRQCLRTGNLAECSKPRKLGVFGR